MTTELLYLRDSSLRSFEAMVVDADESGVALDRTAFYVTGGGQPHDTGFLRWDGNEARVVEVRKRGDAARHTLDGDLPAVGAAVTGEIDWD
ncbi:MAG: alanyl-tRNA editing protein, partial [Actinobacteria bacterium]|nr:alanyl-tRNA editing protein [Actinomycetota bacterium]